MITKDMVVKVLSNRVESLQGHTGKVVFVVEAEQDPAALEDATQSIPPYVVAFDDSLEVVYNAHELMPISFVDQEEATGEWCGYAGPCILCDMPKGVKHLHVKR